MTVFRLKKWHFSQNIDCGYLFKLPHHGGKSKGTCAVDQDDTAYLAVDRVLRLPTKQYGSRCSQQARLKEVTVKSRGISYYFFCQNQLRYFPFPRKVLANYCVAGFHMKRIETMSLHQIFSN